MSDCIKTGPAAYFAINEGLSQSVIAQTCAAYLLVFNEPNPAQFLLKLDDGRYPLHTYAAQYLSWHLQSGDKIICHALYQLLLKLFALPRTSAFVNWIRVGVQNHIRVDHHNTFSWPPVEIELGGTAYEDVQPLYYAALLGLQQVVDHLAEEGADINTLGGKHGTALNAAAHNGHTGTVFLLLERGADVHLEVMNGSALQGAAEQGHTETVQVLLNHSADIHLPEDVLDTVLRLSAGQTGAFQLLLERVADDNLQERLLGAALSAASRSGHIQTVQLLLDRGAEFNCIAGLYITGLHSAAGCGQTEIIRLILERGADVDVLGSYGPMLLRAVQGGHTGTVQFLLEHGADANQVSTDFKTMLEAAARGGRTETARLLLEHGADVGLQAGIYGNTLHTAVQLGWPQIVKLLLDSGADPNFVVGHDDGVSDATLRSADPNNFLGRGGRSVLDAARRCYGDGTAMQKLLREHGALDVEDIPLVA